MHVAHRQNTHTYKVNYYYKIDDDDKDIVVIILKHSNVLHINDNSSKHLPFFNVMIGKLKIYFEICYSYTCYHAKTIQMDVYVLSGYILCIVLYIIIVLHF